MGDDFWALRPSFRAPISEVEAAANLLALAVDSLLAGDSASARSYLKQADMPALRAYARSMQSEVTREVHRFREVAGLPREIPAAERGPREPSRGVAFEIFRHDGFRCRYCGCRVIFPLTESIISALVPHAVRWGRRDIEVNAAFYTLKGVLDHVVPHAHGGGSGPENLVVSCQPCNYGKGNWFIQQIGLSDPRLRPPRVDGWDGLCRILPVRSPKMPADINICPNKERRTAMPSGQSSEPKGAASIDEFRSTFSEPDRKHFDTLMQIIDECVGFGVYCTLAKKKKDQERRYLMVKIPVEGEALNVLGVSPDLAVQVPWSTSVIISGVRTSYKNELRPFAETLAAGLPDGGVLDADTMWRPQCGNRLPYLSELVQDPTVLRDAFAALHKSLAQSKKPNAAGP
jgi:5-methylcytosine-specific restriction endonuclease McrA